ncbi:hypothetical protein NPIL_169831 [Nephila pilipes]|uniref:Uncharacterized protein n=1 Tax=Nephila pilipes TaxID=299642 RepID=A0A8X6JQ54_NEPPI|nr:hypothetical protein NPIL_169831 [Nephila pilipes]
MHASNHVPGLNTSRDSKNRKANRFYQILLHYSFHFTSVYLHREGRFVTRRGNPEPFASKRKVSILRSLDLHAVALALEGQ